MDTEFDLLRTATKNRIEQLGTSRDDELFEFRNAATFMVIHRLLTEYDRLREKAASPAATHSFGTLTAEEAALLEAFRKVDDRSKQNIQIAAEVSLQVEEEYASKPRCDVVHLSTARAPQD